MNDSNKSCSIERLVFVCSFAHFDGTPWNTSLWQRRWLCNTSIAFPSQRFRQWSTESSCACSQRYVYTPNNNNNNFSDANVCMLHRVSAYISRMEHETTSWNDLVFISDCSLPFGSIWPATNCCCLFNGIDDKMCLIVDVSCATFYVPLVVGIFVWNA